MSGARPLLVPDDAPQRREALDPSRSFLVQAPAGSGKTGLLIQRFLRLLAAVERPESVVAITFTRKAAGEMRDRVLDALRGAREGRSPGAPHQLLTRELAAEVLARDQARGWNLLDHASRLRIQTIDSLCASITRQMPWLAGLGAPSNILDDAGELFLEAARRTVLMVETPGEWSSCLETLLVHLDNDGPRLAGLLAEMLERRDQWLRLAVEVDDAVRSRLECSLRRAVEDGLGEVASLVPPECGDSLAGLARYAAANLDGDEPVRACLDLATLPGARAECLPLWLGLASLLLTGDDGLRKRLDVRCGFPPSNRARKRDMEALLGRLEGVPGLHEALAAVRVLPPPRYSEDQWRIVRSLFAVLKLAAAQLRAVFAERGTIDFCELSLASLSALGSHDCPSDLAFSLDARIEHLLVDEFQDTSSSQYELLEKLTAGWEPGDGRTLFLVGDPMQSIYRFRKAEVGLFLRALEHGIGAVRPDFLRLTKNYRSVPEIVAWLNSVFPALFPARSDAAAGAIAYSPCDAAGELSGQPTAQLHCVGTDSEEAALIVRLIREAREDQPDGTLGILVRARSHLPEIVSALREAGIPFCAVEIDCLGERSAVRDLLALTRAMLHLADRVSWLAVLRAPWCGLTLADLEALQNGAGRYWIVWDRLAGDLAALSAEGRARARRLVELLSDAFAERGRWPLRRWVERAWRKLGGPAAARGESDLQDAADYFDLLEERQSGADLDDFDGFTRAVGSLFARPEPGVENRVQVMTMHGAKGLEFDTVILPGLSRRPRPDEPRLVLFEERPRRDGAVDRLIAPIKEAGSDNYPIYRFLHRAEERRNRLETTRLLYVACSRARRRLHLVGQPLPAANTFLRFLLEGQPQAVRAPFEQPPDTPPEAETPAPSPPGLPLRRLPAGWTPPPLPPPVAWEPAAAAAAPRNPDRLWLGDALRHAGTVVHQMLCRIARQGLESWDAAWIEASRPVFRTALGQLGVSPGDIEEAASRVEEALKRTLASDRGRWILASRPGATAEYDVSGVVAGRLVRGAIDRTFLDAGVRWIVDFKTGSGDGGDVEAFLNAERRVYQPQLERYASLLKPLGAPIRLGLYFPLLDGWREWEWVG